jgi:hypothetical protein
VQARDGVVSTVHGCLAYRFVLRCDDPALARDAEALLADFAPRVAEEASYDPPTPVYVIEAGRRPSGARRFALSRDGAQLIVGDDPSRVVDHLVRTVSRLALADPPRDYLLVHAAVAATPAGNGVLLTGESGSGKTTIVAALVQEGYAYLSDEAAVIDPESLLVRPWARPLAFKPTAQAIERFRAALGEAAGRSAHIPVHRLRKGAVGGPAAVRLIVDYRYEGGSPTVVDSLSRAGAVALLGSAAPALREHGDSGLQLLARIVAGASAFRLRTGSLEEAVRWVRTLAEDFS